MNNKINVYLVDDSMEMIHSMKEALTKSDGYQVIGSATNGEQCVNELRGKHLDVLVLDLIMPKMDGLSVMEMVGGDKDLKKQPDFIVVTAVGQERITEDAFRKGASYYIMKPFNPEVLKAKAENLIRMREQLKRIYTKTLMLKHTVEKPEEEEQAGLFMQQVISIVETNLTNPDFSAKSLASLLNLSQPTLYRKMKQQSNLSIIEVIRSIRISKAASLIMQKKYSVQEVAEMVGYNDINTFRKHFTNQFGVSPSRYNAL